jgi:flagellar biosynthesis component FlhA
MPVSGGAVEGESVEVLNVLVEKTFLPKTVILETNTLSRGAMYEVVGSNTILDIHRQGLISKGQAMLITRKTKVDSIIRRLPKMYKMSINNSLEDDQRVVSIWQIFAALGIEDERMGGDY